MRLEDVRTGVLCTYKGEACTSAHIYCVHSGLLHVHLGVSFKCPGCQCFQSFTVAQENTFSDGDSWRNSPLVKLPISSKASSKRAKKVANTVSISGSELCRR